MDFYHFAKSVVYGVLKPLYRLDVKGTEHFPQEGGALVCANHISELDPPVVGITAPRPINFMAKAELFEAPILKNLLPNLHVFPVKRGLSDRNAIRTAVSLLKGGQVVGMFPEGTRSKDGTLGQGMSGAGFFALKGGDAVVVPCAIIGPYRPFRKVKVRYGKPLDITPFRERKAGAEEVTEAIMQEIRLLIEKEKPAK
ncbi:lysophospholipid acyltransferase family protein [Bhargavaea beijingensis]|uniref:1-acyl-sn-glycerol-3-phosphate acyltransferase n=1 Tax=Bhargavaea beijingensis TaxID=426756 RepID=A0A1G7AMW4_9BACL|nr:lysophospholipid acyltransferase family protein [Bhargavaea beijingensis]MCW1928204.1 1-acyl-sn-glycerol-3-phosphate acyltransferase [Bhargavaea beijingensis]RSK37892.1 1-acyl-sn-glycerol-3-phosphate acyltransferase [Bhargavaea beijingensis]SDE16151.1 1-acyl-sn-glycerol-3-phosphate acyltransferase [Bhargavaea beijingensis]